MTNTAGPGPVKVSSGAIYRAVPSSHFSRPGKITDLISLS